MKSYFKYLSLVDRLSKIPTYRKNHNKLYYLNKDFECNFEELINILKKYISIKKEIVLINQSNSVSDNPLPLSLFVENERTNKQKLKDEAGLLKLEFIKILSKCSTILDNFKEGTADRI